jgi:hypothetical protein
MQRPGLRRHGDSQCQESGPAYHFPPSITPPGEAIRLTEANVEGARQTYPWLLEELADWGPCFAVMHNGTAVSVCFSSRIGTDAEAAGPALWTESVRPGQRPGRQKVPCCTAPREACARFAGWVCIMQDSLAAHGVGQT